MKTFYFCLILAVAGASSPVSAAQDAASRAAAIADRDAAEERYQRLNSSVEELWNLKSDQDRKFTAIAEDLRGLRAQLARSDDSKYATREELRKLAEKIQEIDDKRLSDRKLIEDKFAELRSDLKKLLAAPSPSAPKPRAARPETAPAETPASGGAAGDVAANSQEGQWYVVEAGNTLSKIIAAYNETFKSQGRKTSQKLILDANPGLKPASLQIGQRIFIPMVPQ